MAGFQMFGFQFGKKKESNYEIPSVVTKTEEDSTTVVATGGIYGTYIDFDGSIRTEAELVAQYRGAAMYPEVDLAIDDIVNEVIVSEPTEKTISINLDELKVQPNIKEAIEIEFENILRLLDFNHNAYEIFRHWYIDAHLYYQILLDEKNPQAGIQELRYIDPRKIKKIKEVKQQKLPGENIDIIKTIIEYYLYSDRGFSTKGPIGYNTGGTTSTAATGIRLTKDSIIHIPSGLVDINGSTVLGYLHKALKPINQLSSMEDSMVIYRIVRAPQRRIFYVDVGNLPRQKAEQYLRDMMVKFKNRIVYDSSTGQIRDDRKFQTLLEDYWFPRRSDGQATKVETLPSDSNLLDMPDVEYFLRKLYKALNVPISRLDPNTAYVIGRSTEISRDEIKFSKFINRIRNKFAMLFTRAIGVQLVLKNIMTLDEWKMEFEPFIRYDFAKDNFFDELKDIEILNNRVNAANGVMPFVGRFVSNMWVRKNIFKQTDEEIEMMDAEIEQEMQMMQYQTPEEQQAEMEAAVADKNIVKKPPPKKSK